MKNFHVPLPEATYAQLRSYATRSEVPATTLAREAIEGWIKQQEREARKAAIAEFAKQFAGTELDLDPELEVAGAEHLMDTLYAKKAGKGR